MLYFSRGGGPLPGPVYRLGDFQLDCGRFELLRNGRALRLERKPMELLILLVSLCEGQSRLPRRNCPAPLWSSEVFVDTEHGINTAIRKLRYLLRDDPEDPGFIQTVTGMGYRFIAPVAVTGPSRLPSHPSPSRPPQLNPRPAHTEHSGSPSAPQR